MAVIPEILLTINSNCKNYPKQTTSSKQLLMNLKTLRLHSKIPMQLFQNKTTHFRMIGHLVLKISNDLFVNFHASMIEIEIIGKERLDSDFVFFTKILQIFGMHKIQSKSDLTSKYNILILSFTISILLHIGKVYSENENPTTFFV